MPKYYIQDGYEKVVVDDINAERALIKAILQYFSTFLVGGFYIVSERGFEDHSDCEEDEEDLLFDSNYVLDLIQKHRKERGDEDLFG
tara:strand:+ start:611 stop:871 length:261 start_codon:yes stop_codon:yes gene_type:complete